MQEPHQPGQEASLAAMHLRAGRLEAAKALQGLRDNRMTEWYPELVALHLTELSDLLLLCRDVTERLESVCERSPHVMVDDDQNLDAALTGIWSMTEHARAMVDTIREEIIPAGEADDFQAIHALYMKRLGLS